MLVAAGGYPVPCDIKIERVVSLYHCLAGRMVALFKLYRMQFLP